MQRRLCGVALDRIRRIYQLFQVGYDSPMDLRDDEIYSPQTLAALLSVSPRTLESWRKNGVGPPYSRLPNRTVRYKGLDILEWLEKRKSQEHDAG